MISEAEAVRSVQCPWCPERVPVRFRVYSGDVLAGPVVVGLAEHECSAAVELAAAEDRAAA